VADLEAERTLVEGNRELIARMERRIEGAIARLWGDASVEQCEAIAAE
jgi:type I restriction enzyme M protein